MRLKTEDKGQKTEDRRQRTEDSSIKDKFSENGVTFFKQNLNVLTIRFLS